MKNRENEIRENAKVAEGKIGIKCRLRGKTQWLWTKKKRKKGQSKE